jgi:hypothetical protein
MCGADVGQKPTGRPKLYCSNSCRQKAVYKRNPVKRKCKSKEYHKKNKETIKLSLRERRKRNKLRAIEYLGGRCSACEGVFPEYVYDIHHTNPEEKDWAPAALMHYDNWEIVKPELDKCKLLCANCHRIEHHV